jgi:anthranilate phosphoribosyltransferase
MKSILEYLYQHKTLSKEIAKNILTDIVSNKYNASQISSFITVLIMRNITQEELKGFREALLELSAKIDLSAYNPMDVCGTGGDGKNTFNISTLTSFVLAGAGIPVAKHGNYGVSSISGSSNVLEQLGITFHTDEKRIQEHMYETNICFLHAPLFHPSLKYVGPIRKELGVKTFFNILGPLVNPASPKIQMTGVFSLELARMYHYLFQEDPQMKYTIVHALDGFDEISLTGSSKLISNQFEKNINPDYFGFSTVDYKSLFGGDTVEEAAAIFTSILQGKGTSIQNNVVLANATLGIQTYHQHLSVEEAMQLAKDSLLGLKAKQAFETLKQLS